MARKETFFDKFWKDKYGRVVIVQKPNLFIITWVFAAFLSLLLPSGFTGKVFAAVAFVSIVIWAILEMIRGVNYFRRLLGIAVLLLVLAYTVF